jgi:hypothetical protein
VVEPDEDDDEDDEEVESEEPVDPLSLLPESPLFLSDPASFVPSELVDRDEDEDFFLASVA